MNGLKLFYHKNKYWGPLIELTRMQLWGNEVQYYTITQLELRSNSRKNDYTLQYFVESGNILLYNNRECNDFYIKPEAV